MTPALPPVNAWPSRALMVEVLAVCRRRYQRDQAPARDAAPLTRIPRPGQPEVELRAQELLVAPFTGWAGPADERNAQTAVEERLAMQITRHAWRLGYWPRSAPAVTWTPAPVDRMVGRSG